MPTYATFAEVEHAGLITRDHKKKVTDNGTVDEKIPVRLTDTGRALLTEKGPYRGF